MIPVWKIVPHMSKRLLSSSQYFSIKIQELNIPLYVEEKPASWKNTPPSIADTMQPTVEGLQGKIRNIPLTEARKVLSKVSEFSFEGPSIQGTQENYSSGHLTSDLTADGQDVGIISQPVMLYDYAPSGATASSSRSRYLSVGNPRSQQWRQFSTGSVAFGSQGAQALEMDDEEILQCPQGIQGDDCVRYKLWLENCHRYGLAECDEQLQGLQTGRKTLAEIFAEQEETIRKIAESYRRNQNAAHFSASVEGLQGVQSANIPHLDIAAPCPQGVQGDECVRYKLWLKNCNKFGIENCEENLQGFQSGRKTLQEIFDEQEQLIRRVVQQYQAQQRRTFTSSSNSRGEQEVGKTPNPGAQGNTVEVEKLGQKDRLKRAVKDYGSTIIVFHIGISLISLGGFYLAVSSGIDVVGLLAKLGVGESILQSKAVAGAGTFALAYAVHKIFAPVRIGITLSCAPLLVMYLRRIGFLKAPKVKP